MSGSLLTLATSAAYSRRSQSASYLIQRESFSSLTLPLKLEEVDLTVTAVKDGGVQNNHTPSEAVPLVPLISEGQLFITNSHSWLRGGGR